MIAEELKEIPLKEFVDKFINIPTTGAVMPDWQKPIINSLCDKVDRGEKIQVMFTRPPRIF